MKKNLYLALFSAALFLSFIGYGQGFQTVIRIDNIQGESIATGHTGEIDVFSFSDGVSSCSPTTTATAARTVCKAVASTYNFMTRFDKATIPLILATASAKVIPTADVTGFINVGGSPFNFYKVHLESVTVTSVQESGSAGGDNRPTVSISLAFSRIAWQLTIRSTTGGEDEKVSGGWDFALNKAFTYTFQ